MSKECIHFFGPLCITGDQIKEMGRACSMYVVGRLRNRWEDNTKWTFKKWDGRHGLDWTDLAQSMERWLVLVNVVTNMRVP